MADTDRSSVRIEDSAKRVRVYLGGELIADTRSPKLVWEMPYYPAYYLPASDVRMELLSPTDRTEPRRAAARPTTSRSRAAGRSASTPPGR